MKKIRAVLFDLDGTLVNTQAYVFNAFNYALVSQGFKPLCLREVASFAGLPLHAVFRKITGSKNVDKLVKIYFAYQNSHLKLIKPYPHLKQTLAALRKKKIKLAVVTGSYRHSAEKKLKAVGIEKFFNVIVAGDDHNSAKPHGAPYLKAAKWLKVKPSECLVFGDGANDVESGKRAGCVVARAMYGYGAVEPTQFKPDFKVKFLKQVLKLF